MFRWLFSALCLFLPMSMFGQASSVGQWSSVQNWSIVAVHTHVLPTGKVMFYPYSDDPRLWDPANNSITTLPRAGYNIFCTGHSYIEDGRMLVTGGHVQNGWGLNEPATTMPLPIRGRSFPT